MSTSVRKQAAHMFEGFDSIRVPQRQHNLLNKYTLISFQLNYVITIYYLIIMVITL